MGSCPAPSNVPTGSRLMNADQEVTITVTDLGGEYRMQFAKAPTVTAVAGSNTELDIAWDAPTNRGPEIIYYEYSYYYRGGSTKVKVDAPTRTARITGLIAGTRYPVKVRACNSNGTSSSAPTVCSERTTSMWSPVGVATTNNASRSVRRPRIEQVDVPTGPGVDRVYAQGDRIQVRGAVRCAGNGGHVARHADVRCRARGRP